MDGIPINQQYFPFIPQNSIGQGGIFNTDILIQESYPGIIFDGTEANAVTQVIREVNGDFWLVTNADWNPITATWQQNGDNNPSLPAYALVLGDDGSMQRYYAVATLAQNVNVVWTAVFEVRFDGSIFSTPLINLTSNRPNLQLNPVWDDPTDIQTGFELDVTDTASPVASRFENFTLNGSTKWTVRKDGTLVTGIVPFANVTGFVLPANPTFSGTATFLGPAVFDDGINVSGAPAVITDGETVTGGLTADSSHITGNEQVDGNVTSNGTITGANLVLTGAAPVVSYVGEIVTNIATVTAGSLGNEGIPIPRANPSEGWNIVVNIVALGSTSGNPFTFTFTAATFCTGGPYTTTLAAADAAVTSGVFTASSTANNTTNIPSVHVAVSPGGLGKVMVVIVATRVS